MTEVKARLFVLLIGIATLVGCSDPSLNSNLDLKIAVGPYLQQSSPTSDISRLGTGFLIELRQGGKRLNESVEVNVVGPKGWNKDQPVTFSYPASSFWIAAQEMSAEPVVGEYSVSVRSGSGLVSAEAVITSLEPLELPQIETVKLSEKVAVSWSDIAGAAGYYVKLLDTDSGMQLDTTEYTTSSEAIFPLTGVDNASAIVFSANFDTVAETFEFPEQLRMSEGIVEVIAD